MDYSNILPILILIVALFICLVCFRIFFQTAKESATSRPHHRLSRHHKNPVISAVPFREWETGGTFNPAAIRDDDGAVHLFYRAIGQDGLSRIGHARSADGFDFGDRSMYPVYEPLPGYGMPSLDNFVGPRVYDPGIYTSGGGWGGSEDPRTVKIGDRVYMSYVAFEGWNSVRIALTSIDIDDVKKRKWRWRRPQLISPPGEVAKNWVIFPEKIGGKYAILHSIVPEIEVEFVDDLNNIRTYIKSERKHGPQPGRKDYWDSRIRGAGPPPLKTDKGWLLLYHAQDNRDPGKYKIGAMILDHDDPTKILYRSPQPILTPEAHYENDGKPGVVYASGAVILGENLMVYYGGGDKHVCIAETPLRALLDWMVMYGKV